MKKHIIGILIVTLVLILAGGGIWFFVNNRNKKNLYNISCEFITDKDTSVLIESISEAEQLYRQKVSSNETRLTKLQTVIAKIDSFEADLNSYLILSNIKVSDTNKLNKTYKNLSGSRDVLIKNYNEYITRMKGNTNVDGNALQNLYNDIFEKTVNYINSYNSCFKSTYRHVFSKVYKADTIKIELYELYSAGVKDLLSNISNNNFNSTTVIEHLNNGIKLIDNNIHIVSTEEGGEFGFNALNFKKHFRKCDLDNLINNFETYYNTTINPQVEKSNEKLALYYAKQILEM